MLGKFLILATVALASGRPSDPETRSFFAPSDKCPATGHWLLPHEYDCTKFYYCEYGLKWDTPRDCALGTEFSFELQVCVHPAQANCNLPGSPPTEAPAEPTTEEPTTPEPTTEEPTTTTPEPTTTTTTPEPTTTTTTPEPTTTTTTPEPTTTTSTPEPTTTTTTPEPTTTTTTPEPTTTTTTPEPTTTTTTPEPTTTTTTPEPTTTTTTPEPTTTTTTQAPTTTEANEEPTTTEASNPDLLPNGCPADFEVHQLLPHADCSKFYYCNFGEKVERDCAPGTHFNPVIQVCDWPANAGCQGDNGDGDNGSGDNSDGDNGSGDNGSGDNGSGDNGSGDNGSGDNGDGDNGSGDNGDGDNGSGDNGGTLPNGCPADFEVHQLLPHAECNKFYYCNFGEKVERECAPGTHFNPVKQVCDWPANAGCQGDNGDGDNGSGDNGDGDNGSGDNGSGDNGSGDNGSGDNGDGDNGSGDNGSGDNGSGDNGSGDNGGTLPNGCPADFEVHQLLPHAECNKFYYCNFGEKVERECAPGTHFNPVKQVCDWPANAGCQGDNGDGDNESEDNGDGDNGSGDNGSGDNGSGDNGSGDNGDGDNGSGDNGSGDNGDGDNGSGDSGSGDNGSGDNGSGDNGGTLPNGCPADFEVHQLLPHAECNKFYYCNFGEKVERECAPGTHFNPVKQVCDWPWNAGCQGDNGDGDNGSGDNGDGDNGSGDNGDGDNGSGDNGSGDNGDGDNGSGDNGSGDNGSGDNGSGDNGGTLPNGCPADFEVHQLLPHAECNKFYYCNFGEKVERECAPGTHFNPVKQVCDWPWNAGCEGGNGDGSDGDNGSGDNGSGDNGSGDNGSGDNGSGDNGSGDNGSGDNGSGDNGSGDNGGTLPNGCPADFEVHQLLPHEECDKFYYCVFGEKVERECAPGTHFNAEKQVCDWPWNAGCDNGDNGDGDNGDGDNGDGDNGDGDNGDGDNGDGDNGDGDNGDGDNGDGDNGDGDNGDGDNGDGDNGDGDNGDGDNGDGDNGDGDNGDGDNGTLPNGCPADFNDNQLLPHANCSKFYYCVNGEKVETECAAGTHFNPVEQVCDWPWNAGCDDSYGGGNEDGDGDGGDDGAEDGGNEDGGDGDGDNGDGDNGDGDNGDGDNGDGDNGDGDNGNGSGDGSNDNKCKEQCNILPWAHETDCDKYWRCEGENAVLVTCSEGLHFNAKTATCDFICNANCERDEIQSTAEASGLKLFVPWDKVDDEIKHILEKQH